MTGTRSTLPLHWAHEATFKSGTAHLEATLTRSNGQRYAPARTRRITFLLPYPPFCKTYPTRTQPTQFILYYYCFFVFNQPPTRTGARTHGRTDARTHTHACMHAHTQSQNFPRVVCDNIVRFNSNLSAFHGRHKPEWPDHPDNFRKGVAQFGCDGIDFESWVRSAFPALCSTFDGYIPAQGEIHIKNFMSGSGFVLSKYIQTLGPDAVATAVLHYERLRMMFAVTKAVNAMVAFCTEQQNQGPQETTIVSAAGVGAALRIGSTSPRASLWIDTQSKPEPEVTATAALMAMAGLFGAGGAGGASGAGGAGENGSTGGCTANDDNGGGRGSSNDSGNSGGTRPSLRATASSTSLDSGNSSGGSCISLSYGSPSPPPLDPGDGLTLAAELCRRGGVAIECGCGAQFWCEPVVGYQTHAEQCPVHGVFKPSFHVRGSPRFPPPVQIGSRFQMISVRM